MFLIWTVRVPYAFCTAPIFVPFHYMAKKLKTVIHLRGRSTWADRAINHRVGAFGVQP